MALGIYIAVVVVGILAVITIKLIRNTDKASYFGEPNRCRTCGRKSQTDTCPFCKHGSKSLR